MYDYYVQVCLNGEKIMSKNIMKRFVCGVLALASMSACVATTTSCETNNPEVQITLSFNEKTYELNYQLFREISPRTAKHFLWLAENGYYDGLCVHSYEEGSSKMYTGAYTYENGELVYKDYYGVVQGYENFPVSVWMSKEGQEFLYTVCGEFEDNNFTVESGATRQSYGSLTMYYTEKDVDDRVCVDYLGERAGERAYRDYRYNSATSLFYISLSKSNTRNTNYTTFATLLENSKETLEEFEEDLADYIESNYDEEDTENGFTEQRVVTVDADDVFGDAKTSDTFFTPKKAIVIEKVKVVKY